MVRGISTNSSHLLYPCHLSLFVVGAVTWVWFSWTSRSMSSSSHCRRRIGHGMLLFFFFFFFFLSHFFSFLFNISAHNRECCLWAYCSRDFNRHTFPLIDERRAPVGIGMEGLPLVRKRGVS